MEPVDSQELLTISVRSNWRTQLRHTTQTRRPFINNTYMYIYISLGACHRVLVRVPVRDRGSVPMSLQAVTLYIIYMCPTCPSVSATVNNFKQ